jgi:hypothetical protein
VDTLDEIMWRREEGGVLYQPRLNSSDIRDLELSQHTVNSSR